MKQLYTRSKDSNVRPTSHLKAPNEKENSNAARDFRRLLKEVNQNKRKAEEMEETPPEDPVEVKKEKIEVKLSISGYINEQLGKLVELGEVDSKDNDDVKKQNAYTYLKRIIDLFNDNGESGQLSRKMLSDQLQDIQNDNFVLLYLVYFACKHLSINNMDVQDVYPSLTFYQYLNEKLDKLETINMNELQQAFYFLERALFTAKTRRSFGWKNNPNHIFDRRENFIIREFRTGVNENVIHKFVDIYEKYKRGEIEMDALNADFERLSGKYMDNTEIPGDGIDLVIPSGQYTAIDRIFKGVVRTMISRVLKQEMPNYRFAQSVSGKLDDDNTGSLLRYDFGVLLCDLYMLHSGMVPPSIVRRYVSWSKTKKVKKRESDAEGRPVEETTFEDIDTVIINNKADLFQNFILEEESNLEDKFRNSLVETPNQYSRIIRNDKLNPGENLYDVFRPRMASTVEECLYEIQRLVRNSGKTITLLDIYNKKPLFDSFAEMVATHIISHKARNKKIITSSRYENAGIERGKKVAGLRMRSALQYHGYNVPRNIYAEANSNSKNYY